MAGEFQAFAKTGNTVYGQVLNESTGQIWNTVGAAFENYATANIADYDVAMTEQGTASGIYKGNMPAVAAGVYTVLYRRRADGAPAEADQLVHMQTVPWDGSAHVTLYSRLAPTVAGRTLDVSAGGEAGLDWANVGSQTTTVGLSGTTVGVVTLTNTLTTYTGNALQTGDSFARIGAAGAGLTDLGGMSTAMKAQVETEANDALVGQNLDHLLKVVAVAGDAVDDSIIARLASKSATPSFASFVNTTDSLEAIRDNMPTVTAGGVTLADGVTHGGATATLQLGTFTVTTNAIAWNAAWDAEVQSEVADALIAFFVSSAQLVDDIWDEMLTSATHNVATSAGRRLRNLHSSIAFDGTATAGASQTITLPAGASAVDNFYSTGLMLITVGTGAGQGRYIVNYNGTTKVTTLIRPWLITPDATSEFVVIAGDLGDMFVRFGVAQAGTSTSITLDTGASATEDIFKGLAVRVFANTGQRQLRIITAYNGTTKVATVSPAWAVTPDSTSVFGLVIVGGPAAVQSMADNVLTADAIAADAIGSSELAATAASEIATAVRTELTTEMGRIDVAVSTRLATTGYTAPDNASITAIKAKTDLIPASPAAVGSAMTLTSGERDSIAAALLDLADGVETAITLRNLCRAVGAALAGVLSGAATTTVTIKAIGNAGTTRITATVDADGNRSALTLNL